MQKPIYLDYNATTPVDQKVLDKMLPYFSEHFGNAHSKMHPLGWEAEGVVDIARDKVAKLWNCTSDEVVFTSGSTEALNTALVGTYERYGKHKNHIITCRTEHSAIYEACKYLETKEASVTYLEVDKNGNISLDDLQSAITEQTYLVALMMANNETGVLHDVASIGKICKEENVLFLCDTTQAVGKIPVDVQALNIDMAVMSAHKMYGPKGVGALFVRRRSPRVTFVPQIHGGGQEKGRRAGTLNVPGIVGLSACELLSETEKATIDTLRAKLECALEEMGCIIVGKDAARMFNVITAIFPKPAMDVLKPIQMKVAVSLGSACSSGSGKPSRVLTEMGFTSEEMKGAIRFSLGKYTSEADIESVISLIREAL